MGLALSMKSLAHVSSLEMDVITQNAECSNCRICGRAVSDYCYSSISSNIVYLFLIFYFKCLKFLVGWILCRIETETRV